MMMPQEPIDLNQEIEEMAALENSSQARRKKEEARNAGIENLMKQVNP